MLGFFELHSFCAQLFSFSLAMAKIGDFFYSVIFIRLSNMATYVFDLNRRQLGILQQPRLILWTVIPPPF